MQPFRANWREASEYPPVACNDRHRLAWEFLRRNPDYAKHFAQMQKLAEGEFEKGLGKKSESVLDGLECWPPALAGETAKTYYVRVKDLAKGIKGRIDKPYNTFLNRWMLQKPVDPATHFDPLIVMFVPYQLKVKRGGSPNKKQTAIEVEENSLLESKSYPLFLYPNELAVRFRLDLPWTKQIKHAKQRFDEEENELRRALAIKKGALTGNKIRSGQQIAMLGETREKEVLKTAHFMLRSYDAFTQEKVLLGDVKRKTALESGEKEVRSYFTKEAKDSGKKLFFERGKVDGLVESAESYILGLKLLTLVGFAEPS